MNNSNNRNNSEQLRKLRSFGPVIFPVVLPAIRKARSSQSSCIDSSPRIGILRMGLASMLLQQWAESRKTPISDKSATDGQPADLTAAVKETVNAADDSVWPSFSNTLMKAWSPQERPVHIRKRRPSNSTTVASEPRKRVPTTINVPLYAVDDFEAQTRRIQILIALLAFVPTCIFLALETNTNRCFGKLRVYNLTDLFILSPFYHYILTEVHFEVFRPKLRSAAARITSALMALFQLGRVLHSSVDAVHTYATEVNSYQHRMPSDVLQLIHFLDEDLGHWFLWLPYFALLGLFAIYAPMQNDAKTHSNIYDASVPFVCGGLMGASFAVAVIESSHYWIGIVAAPWLVLCGLRPLWLGRHCPSSPAISARLQSPLPGLTVWMAVGLVLGLMIYRCIVGSFTEPSELGGIFTIAKGALRQLCTHVGRSL